MLGRLIKNYNYDAVANKLYPPVITSGAIIGGVYGAYNSDNSFGSTVGSYLLGGVIGVSVGFLGVMLHPLLITGVIPIGMYGYKNYKNYKKI